MISPWNATQATFLTGCFHFHFYSITSVSEMSSELDINQARVRTWKMELKYFIHIYIDIKQYTLVAHSLKYLNEIIINKYSDAGILKIHENKLHSNTHFISSEISTDILRIMAVLDVLPFEFSWLL